MTLLENAKWKEKNSLKYIGYCTQAGSRVGRDPEMRFWITLSSIQPMLRPCQYYSSSWCSFRSSLTRRPSKATDSYFRLLALWLYFTMSYVPTWLSSNPWALEKGLFLPIKIYFLAFKQQVVLSASFWWLSSPPSICPQQIWSLSTLATIQIYCF